MKKPECKKINLCFIVCGVDVPIEIGERCLLRTARKEALRVSNNIARPAEDWVIHSDAGKALLPNRRIITQGIQDGDRVFLNLSIGCGGSACKQYTIVTQWCMINNEYQARCVEIPGCTAGGRSREDAENNVWFEIQKSIALSRELGLEHPPPTF